LFACFSSLITLSQIDQLKKETRMRRDNYSGFADGTDSNGATQTAVVETTSYTAPHGKTICESMDFEEMESIMWRKVCVLISLVLCPLTLNDFVV
jgi:hypothetical protein